MAQIFITKINYENALPKWTVILSVHHSHIPAGIFWGPITNWQGRKIIKENKKLQILKNVAVLLFKSRIRLTMSIAKNWCFTWNNPTLDRVRTKELLQLHAGYYVFQLEKGANETPHYQGYIQFVKRKTLTSLKTIIPQAHWEVARGTWIQNKTYCTKEPRLAGPEEYGVPVTQGQRIDLELFRDAILDGKKDLELIMDFPRECAQYNRFIQFVRTAKIPTRVEKPNVIVYWGPSGSGKTRRSFDLAGRERTYVVSRPDSGRPLWWDGYNPTHHTVIVIDDFYGWLPWSYLLQLLDRYPFQVEIKGGKIQFDSPNIFITSNTEPKTWYKNIPNDDMTPLLRRIDHIYYLANL